MREIKFRAWDSLSNEMAEYIHETDKSGMTSFEDYLRDPRHEVMQFTGTYDKTKREIYEGDIVQSANAYWEVRWNDELARFEFVIPRTGAEKGFGRFFGMDAFEVEVIGNIHENPELLTA